MPVGKRNKAFLRECENPQSCDLWGFSIPKFLREDLSPQAGYRLLIAIQPFDDVVASYTRRDSDNKRNKTFHPGTPFLLPVSGR